MSRPNRVATLVRPRRPRADLKPPQVSAVLALQRTAGNRAVQRLLGVARTPSQENVCDDPDYCTPYATAAQAATAESWLRMVALPTLEAKFGTEVHDLWESYLSRRPGDSLTPQVFETDGNPIEESVRHLVGHARRCRRRAGHRDGTAQQLPRRDAAAVQPDDRRALELPDGRGDGQPADRLQQPALEGGQHRRRDRQQRRGTRLPEDPLGQRHDDQDPVDRQQRLHRLRAHQPLRGGRRDRLLPRPVRLTRRAAVHDSDESP